MVLVHQLLHQSRIIVFVERRLQSTKGLLKPKDKDDNTWSFTCEIKIGPSRIVVHFFSIFINDLPYALDLSSKIFADDTTLYETYDLKTGTFDKVVQDFKDKLSLFNNWCIFNRLDINWSKTHFIIVCLNNKILLPDFVKIENHDSTLIDEFKLLEFYYDIT